MEQVIYYLPEVDRFVGEEQLKKVEADFDMELGSALFENDEYLKENLNLIKQQIKVEAIKHQIKKELITKKLGVHGERETL